MRNDALNDLCSSLCEQFGELQTQIDDPSAASLLDALGLALGGIAHSSATGEPIRVSLLTKLQDERLIVDVDRARSGPAIRAG